MALSQFFVPTDIYERFNIRRVKLVANSLFSLQRQRSFRDRAIEEVHSNQKARSATMSNNRRQTSNQQHMDVSRADSTRAGWPWC
jgi:hypothetical protein